MSKETWGSKGKLRACRGVNPELAEGLTNILNSFIVFAGVLLCRKKSAYMQDKLRLER